MCKRIWVLKSPFLNFSLKVVKINAVGEEVECVAGDDFSCINLLANSIWKQGELTANGTELIDQSSSTYAYKAYIETMLSYNYESKNCHLKTSIFAKDNPETCTQNNTIQNDKTSGYAIRKLMVSENKTVSFLTSLHIDFLNANRLLPPG